MATATLERSKSGSSRDAGATAKEKERAAKAKEKEREAKRKEKEREAKGKEKEREAKRKEKEREAKRKEKEREAKRKEKEREAKRKEKEREAKRKEKEREGKGGKAESGRSSAKGSGKGSKGSKGGKGSKGSKGGKVSKGSKGGTDLGTGDTQVREAGYIAESLGKADQVTRSTKSPSLAASYTTRDHEVIRAWAESRGGVPADVRGTGDGESDPGVLRIEFRDPADDLEEVSWDAFFRTFDESDVDFLYQEHTADGSESRFFKIVRAGS